MSAVVVGSDGLARCPWQGIETDELYQRYHDTEWGRPVSGERDMFERLSLEAFQSGLSWITILRKRDAFRTAFAGFDPHAVAAFTDDDVARLLDDAGIVRNAAKINATIANARALLALPDGTTLASIVAAHAPAAPRPATDPVPDSTPESVALAKELKRNGFRFVGPTTAYAMMQAIGLVDDHAPGCWVHDAAGRTT
ncbi:DNA-3-methyladenine glycosylase I [Specibacter cremeus]|uniref:DNA-3-methyladenine glycosylase I n=1 Tax=Specibacter cremeus TaxID=1629051 RepID=UPI000F7965D5|nr:DNA-3-methyladenine glycosylase I [Specibacter cremeus]